MIPAGTGEARHPYAAGYIISEGYIIRVSVFHPFRKERISLLEAPQTLQATVSVFTASLYTLEKPAVQVIAARSICLSMSLS